MQRDWIKKVSRLSPALMIALTLCAASSARARYVPKSSTGKQSSRPDRVLVLDGRSVHNVGSLQMNITNWGEFGSRPDTGLPYSWGPSAQWPAGSGTEYLFTAGLWVGALFNGVPAVSTAAFDQEFRPSQDPLDIIYRSSAGKTGGNRGPHPQADDDSDGSIDEDRLDGHDNDGDGRVDEDYAAISGLMFTCQYTDNQPITTKIYPEHNPLDILVYQQTFQWGNPRFDDFIGVEFHITNIGRRFLDDVYVGMLVDGDAGPRNETNYWLDDLTARVNVPAVCTDLGPVSFDFAYTFDADGDDGNTPGRFGVLVLDYPTDPEGMLAPTTVGLRTYNYFAGNKSFEEGGDPTTDFQRYEILSQGGIQSNPDLARDYRMLISVGPFSELYPDSSLVVKFAFVIGADDDVFANVANAKIAYEGAWFNLDHNGITGVDGRENPVHGPAQSVWVDSCRIYKPPFEFGCDVEERRDGIFNKPFPRVEEDEILWTNADCQTECLYRIACGYTNADSMMFRTGVAGRESQVNWIVASAPPPPNMRVDDQAREGVVVYWDSASEGASDNFTQTSDFEGYQVHRAANWTRPLGTSEVTGPPSDLWDALFQADIINRFGEDRGFEGLRYEPLRHTLSPSEERDLINAILQDLIATPKDEPACPQGVSEAVCDTLKAIARDELGLPDGRHYYRYVDRNVHLGRPYFYSVVAFDHNVAPGGRFVQGLAGVPASNFVYVEPKSSASEPYEYPQRPIYVVPNPATKKSMADWSLDPTNDDPSGTKIEFRNLPRATGVARIYTISGDLVIELPFDGRTGNGTLKWDLISRNGQDVTSGVYLYSIEADEPTFDRTIGKFTIIR